MSYITTGDYLLQIQDVNLQQIINSNEAIRDNANLLAIAEARSYLVKEFNIDAELLKTGADRDPQLLSTIVDIALYHLHTRLAPKNIPTLRETRYENAITWLKMCALGEITPSIDKYDIVQGLRIRYGGNAKKINQY